MAITEERMLRLISAAETCRDLGKGLHEALTSWRPQAEKGELSGVAVIDAALRFINMNLPSPYDLATIEIERRHFTSNRSRLYRSRERMAERKEGLPPRRPPNPKKKKPNEKGYFTAPHDPTGAAIGAAAPAAPAVKPLTDADLAEAEALMAADKAELAARTLPKVAWSLPPPGAPTNPYVNDGMPDVRAEPKSELTPDEARAKVAESREPTS